MKFAQELITSKTYSFAFECACQTSCIDMIIKCLFDKNKPVVRQFAMKILAFIIDKINGDLAPKSNQDQELKNKRSKQMEYIIDAIIGKLSHALQVASDHQGIDNSNIYQS